MGTTLRKGKLGHLTPDVMKDLEKATEGALEEIKHLPGTDAKSRDAMQRGMLFGARRTLMILLAMGVLKDPEVRRRVDQFGRARKSAAEAGG